MYQSATFSILSNFFFSKDRWYCNLIVFSRKILVTCNSRLNQSTHISYIGYPNHKNIWKQYIRISIRPVRCIFLRVWINFVLWSSILNSHCQQHRTNDCNVPHFLSKSVCLGKLFVIYICRVINFIHKISYLSATYILLTTDFDFGMCL